MFFARNKLFFAGYIHFYEALNANFHVCSFKTLPNELRQRYPVQNLSPY